MPTLTEYHDWLESEEIRKNPELKKKVVPVRLDGGAEKNDMDKQTNNLIESILTETQKQVEEEKIVKIDSEDGGQDIKTEKEAKVADADRKSTGQNMEVKRVQNKPVKEEKKINKF